MDKPEKMSIELRIAYSARTVYLSVLRFAQRLNARKQTSINLSKIRELNETDNFIQNMIDDLKDVESMLQSKEPTAYDAEFEGLSNHDYGMGEWDYNNYAPNGSGTYNPKKTKEKY